MKQLDINLHQLLMKTATHTFKGQLLGKAQYGWHEKSIGQAILIPNEPQLWLKACLLENHKFAESYLNRLTTSDRLESIDKPIIKKYFIYPSRCEPTQQEKIIVIILMTYIDDMVCSTTAELTYPFKINELWLGKLKKQLNSLASQNSDFVACRQDLINRRIQERFGNNIPTLIEHWATIHGDIHWSNLTQKNAIILDWEGWGTGPCFLDICLLYCFSLIQDSVASFIKSYFSEQFNTLDAKICLLFSCSELMRMYELHGDYKNLYSKLKILSNTLYNEIVKK